MLNNIIYGAGIVVIFLISLFILREIFNIILINIRIFFSKERKCKHFFYFPDINNNFGIFIGACLGGPLYKTYSCFVCGKSHTIHSI